MDAEPHKPPDYGAQASRHPLLGRCSPIDGWLFRGRRTRIQLSDGWLQGSGAGVGVLIPAFDAGIEWFSAMWGDYDDNVRALQVNESVTGPVPRTPYPNVGPLRTFVEGVREFRLDESIARAAGLEMTADRLVETPGILRVVDVHDDCFWAICPVDDATIRAVARQILALHEDYLHDVGGFAAYVEPLFDLIAGGETVRMKTFPGGELRVTHGDGVFDKRSRTWRLGESASIGP